MPAHARLAPGLPVSLGAAGDGAGRVQLAPGTVRAPFSGYEEGAVIPRADWRDLRAGERALVVAKERRPDGPLISILEVPSSALAGFRALRAATAKSRTRDDLIPVLSSRNCASALRAFQTFARRHYQILNEDGARERLAGGIRVNPPGLATTTEGSAKGVFVGLHLDDWSDLPLAKRKQAPNRICVNLGSQDRFLLFLNLPIDQVREAVRRHRSAWENASGTATARAFFGLFPSYPVLRIRLKPGEAYIAPTECMIHDGSSLGMTVPDVSLSLRGRFDTGMRSAGRRALNP